MGAGGIFLLIILFLAAQTVMSLKKWHDDERRKNRKR